jgi:hypothetical protein
LTSRFHVLRDLLQAHGHLCGTTGTTLGRLTMRVVEALVHPVKCLFGLHDGLVSRPLFGSHRGRDGLTQFMLDMEEVWGVMRPQVVFDRRQQARCFITGRLYARAVDAHKGLLHQHLPGIVIPRLGGLLEQDRVAHGFDPNQTEPTRKGFILRQRDIFRWHLVRQTLALCTAVRHKRFLNVAVDLLGYTQDLYKNYR